MCQESYYTLLLGKLSKKVYEIQIQMLFGFLTIKIFLFYLNIFPKPKKTQQENLIFLWIWHFKNDSHALLSCSVNVIGNQSNPEKNEMGKLCEIIT